MNIVGPPLGKVSVVPDMFPEWNVNQAIAVFRPVVTGFRLWLVTCILTESILSRITKKAKATAGQFNLTLELCRDLPLPLPPMEEQRRIVAEVERILLRGGRTRRRAWGLGLKQAERLRQAILRDAFAGKLVPQDPRRRTGLRASGAHSGGASYGRKETSERAQAERVGGTDSCDSDARRRDGKTAGKTAERPGARARRPRAVKSPTAKI